MKTCLITVQKLLPDFIGHVAPNFGKQIMGSSLVALLLILFFLQGCTTCKQVRISNSVQGTWNADVRYRKCGSASGYSVAVYRATEGPPRAGEGDKEPFKTIFKTGHGKPKKVPITVAWKADGHLAIYHETRMSVEDDESKPMVVRADTEYQGVLIEYFPRPNFWSYRYAD